MPVFALANADVRIQGAGLATPVAFGVALALVLGKPAGIVLFSLASVRAGLTRLPAGGSWEVLGGARCLGGLGFTVSLFIAGLAFDGRMRDEAKTGILAGSAVSGVLGFLLLWTFLPRPSGEQPSSSA